MTLGKNGTGEKTQMEK